MADKKIISGAAALFLAGSMAGAGVMKAAVPSATAVLDGINVGPDGSFGLRVHGVIGGASYAHTLNYDSTGANPLIDSQVSAIAADVGPPLATCIGNARTQLTSHASDLAAWTPTVTPSPSPSVDGGAQ